MSRDNNSHVLDNARLLIRAITTDLAKGTEYYDKNGVRLTTVEDVLRALRLNGEMEIRPRDIPRNN